MTITKNSTDTAQTLTKLAQEAVSTDLVFKSVEDFLAQHYPHFSLLKDQSQVAGADNKAFLHIKDSSGGADTTSSSALGKALTDNVLTHVAPGMSAEVVKLT
jgi:hypothetical protein